MKSAFSIAVAFLFISSSVLAQNNTPVEERKNEIRVNLLNSIIGSVEVQYEKLLEDNSSFGINLGVGYGNDKGGYNHNDGESAYNTLVNLTPTYRMYFSKVPGRGFFIEGSTRLSYDKYVEYPDYYDWNNFISGNEFNFGIGLGIGGKLVTSKGLVGSLKGGVGRFITENRNVGSSYYPNIEIAIGKRF